MECDLSSRSSVRSFAAEFKASGLPLHVLINNGAVMSCDFTRSADGHELQVRRSTHLSRITDRFTCDLVLFTRDLVRLTHDLGRFTQFAVNHLAHHLLSNLLLETLAHTAKAAGGSEANAAPADGQAHGAAVHFPEGYVANQCKENN